jgi:hypothetical protein
MARALRDLHASLVDATERTRIQSAYITIKAAGAVDTAGTGYRSPAGVTVANTGTGTFSVVFPACSSMVMIPFVAKSATPTIFDVIPTAINPTAGTASLQTCNAAGSATNPASGDVIGILFVGIPIGLSSI